MVGCSFESVSATNGAPGAEADTSSTSDTDTAAPGTGTDDKTSGVNPTEPDTGASDPTTDPSDPSSTSGPSETEGDPTVDPTGGIDVDIGCPEPLPNGWILCEDFEGIENPAAHFSFWEGGGIGIGEGGRESPSAFEVTHNPGVDWSGVAEIRFGAGPPANNVAQPGARFDEVWVRFHTRVEQGWPVAGPGDLVELEGIDNNGATTFMSRVSASQFEPQLWSAAHSCINYDYVYCDGVEDWLDFAWLGNQRGQAAVFEAPTAQDWTCVVMHARLNSPGQQDGVMEILVGDTLDNQLLNLNYRGILGDFGFNRLSLPTYMEFPLEATYRRYIDDVVVSSTSLDCDEFL